MSALDPGPDRAVEVVAVFDDTVVAARHLRRPPPASRRWPLVTGLGGLLLIAAASSFAWSVDVAGDDARRRAAHLDAGRAAHAFRPQRLPRTLELFAGGGLAFGLLLVSSGLARRRDARSQPSSFLVGGDAGVDLALDGCPGRHALVALGEGGLVELAVPPGGALLEVRRGGEAIATDDFGARFALPTGCSARLRHGACTVHVAPIAAPRRGSAASRPGLDRRTVAFAGGSALVHGLVLALLHTLPPDAGSLVEDDGARGERLVLVRQPAHERARQEERASGGDAGAASAASLERGGGTEGGGGGGMPEAGRAEPAAPSTAAEARRRARHAGALGLLEARHRFAAVTGGADFAGGLEVGTWGRGPGEGGGLDGAGTGGWGHGIDGLGGPPLRTIAAGGFELGGGDRGPAGPTAGPRRTGGGPPVVRIDTATVPADIDKALIRRHVRRKLARIRHCYERRLVARPELAGTVVTRFTIGNNGTVIAARATGIGDRELEACVANVVTTIAFPAMPPGAGIVNIMYPFTFQRAGS